jgi:hypothetical protein
VNDQPSLETLVAELKRMSGAAQSLPPVHLWNPDRCAEGDFEILRDGSWKHEGGRIGRESMVRLFASILRKDADGATYLVTPTEKLRVAVADAAFVAIRVDRATDAIIFTTNVGDVVAAGPENPIRIEVNANGEPQPYVLVRGRLEARILRAPFYEMVEWAEERDGRLGLASHGVWFDLGRVDGF